MEVENSPGGGGEVRKRREKNRHSISRSRAPLPTPNLLTLTSATNSMGWSPTPPLAAIDAICTTPDPSFSTDAGASLPPWTIGGSWASASAGGGGAAAASASASGEPGAGAPLPPTPFPLEAQSRFPSLEVYRALPSSETVR